VNASENEFIHRDCGAFISNKLKDILVLVSSLLTFLHLIKLLRLSSVCMMREYLVLAHLFVQVPLLGESERTFLIFRVKLHRLLPV